LTWFVRDIGVEEGRYVIELQLLGDLGEEEEEAQLKEEAE
jgi:hypothetical protein